MRGVKPGMARPVITVLVAARAWLYRRRKRRLFHCHPVGVHL